MIDIQSEEQRLAKYQKALAQHEESLARIEGMIEKASAKRRAEPNSERDYNKILDNLDEAHRQAKSDIIDTTKTIDRIEKRIAKAKEGGDDADIAEEESASAHDLKPPTDDTRDERSPQFQAAKLLASTAINKLDTVPLEKLTLAQEYIDDRTAEGPLTPYDAQIAARLEVAAQSERKPEPKETERRGQRDLRAMIDMVSNERFTEMTLEEIEMAASCHALLVRKTTPTEEDLRILNLISPPLQKLSRILENLRTKMRR